MADVRPFAGIRYNPQRFGRDLSDVVCPPYDVISPAEQRALNQHHPCNVVRLELPEPGDGVDRYQHAARIYRGWLEDHTLTPETAPALYAYLQRFTIDGVTHERRGLVAALRAEQWESGAVRPHERTLLGPKRDRLELMRACHANFSPIWGLYRGGSGVAAPVWESALSREPDAAATDADGVRHSVWVVSDPGALGPVHASLAAGPVYIADGHHRYETALHYRTELASGAPLAEDAAANFAMTYLVESADPGLIVLGTHRLLQSSPPGGAAALRQVLASQFDLSDDSKSPAELLARLEEAGEHPSFGIWSPQLGLATVARLRAPAVPEALAGGHAPAWRRLDLAALHTLAIDRLCPEGTSELSESGRLMYTRRLTEVEEAVGSGRAALAFVVRRTPVEQIMAVADAGDLMPEKSTYFFPKPVTGLVIGSLDGQVTVPC